MASQSEEYDANRTVTGKWQGAGAESRTGGRSSFDDSVTMGVGEWRERTWGERFKVGQVMLGHYEIKSELGRGGMGVVYRCFHQVAGVDVAVKALSKNPEDRFGSCVEFVDALEGKGGESGKGLGGKWLAAAACLVVALACFGGYAWHCHAESAREEAARLAEERAKVAAEAARLAEEKRLANGVVTLPGGVELEMVKVEAGSFTMGSPEGEDGRFVVERLHRVTLTQDFWLGKYEVTRAQWKAVMGNNPSLFEKGGDYPVENVDWNDAQAFCKKLNEQYAGKLPSGYCFGLPTEAQWEYACRAGTTTAFHYGDASDARKMNHDGKYPCGGGSKGACLERTTTPVGSYAPNAWGLYDMSGNVWEWCEDWYGEYGGDAVDPRGAGSGSRRVVRGGSWSSSAGCCRSAYRYDYEPTDRYVNVGFRLALRPIQREEAARVARVSENDRKAKERAKVAAEVARLAEEKRLANGVVTLPGGVELEMVKVEAGSFTMGSPEGEDGRSRGETQHRVTLTKDFWLGKYEVTQAQWKAVMGNNPSRFKKGGDYPVEMVSWKDAQAFCNKLNEQYAGRLPSGYRFGLPTEAQWEYACRGGNLSKGYTYSGSDDADKVAWYYENSSDSRLDDDSWNVVELSTNRCRTHPVGGKSPNELGLYDMSGNVWEWCEDWYGSYGGDGVDPRGADSGSGRVVRGGSWSRNAGSCRSANRAGNEPSCRSYYLGFRLALRPIH